MTLKTEYTLLRTREAAPASTTMVILSKTLFSMLAVSSIVLFLQASTVASSTFMDLSDSQDDVHPLDEAFSTHNVYWNQTGSSPPRDLEGYGLIQTQLVSRHAIRYPTSSNIKQIQTLLEKLEPYQDALPKWLQGYRLPYNLSIAGDLSESGVLEMKALSHRILEATQQGHAAKYSKDQYRVANTHVERTHETAVAFASEYFGNPDQVDYITFPEDKDPLLRFYDDCPEYTSSIKHNEDAQEEYYAFKHTDRVEALVVELKEALHIQETPVDLNVTDLHGAYSACAFDYALYNVTDHWCSLLSPTTLYLMDYASDLHAFYTLAGGHHLNYQIASPLFRDLYMRMQQRSNNTDMAHTGTFYFAHAETVLPLLTLLGYGSRDKLRANYTMDEIFDRDFRASSLSPFATNVQFRLYRDLEDSNRSDLLQIVVNEVVADIPGCKALYCELSEIEEAYEYFLYDFDFDAKCKRRGEEAGARLDLANVEGMDEIDMF